MQACLEGRPEFRQRDQLGIRIVHFEIFGLRCIGDKREVNHKDRYPQNPAGKIAGYHFDTENAVINDAAQDQNARDGDTHADQTLLDSFYITRLGQAFHLVLKRFEMHDIKKSDI